MNLTTFAQFGRSGKRLVWGGALTVLLLAAGATAIGDVHPDAKRLVDQRRESFSLFAGPTAVLRGNQLQCGLTNDGNGTCTDIFNSPTGGGGFWPTGSPNQYIFNTGVQVAGIMGADGGPWANDTVGAFFFDASGLRPSGTALTNIYDSLNPDDLANWPAEAFVDDPDLFQDVLVGRKAASQQDSWMQYWDGSPTKLSGRQHPMGIRITSRSLAWNFPAGNESLIYFIFEYENVTDEAEFQDLNEAFFFAGNNELPDAGISLNDVYAAFATDMDVGSVATDNYSTAILPFDLGLSYHGGFRIPAFEYSPDIFFPPFFTDAPGLIGVKYLKSPLDPITGEEVGLTLFSATLRTGVGVLPDPGTDKQLWRYLSGTLNPAQGDVPCSITAEITNADPALVQRSLCFLTESAEDTRFFQSSGPFSLLPDESAKVVVAYIAAATVATMSDGLPSGISANDPDDNANPPGVPSFHPGFPSSRGCTDEFATTCTEQVTAPNNPVKNIERGAGWDGYTGVGPTTSLEGPQGKLSQFDVTTIPGSLLGKALVAQTIFDSKFLLGFAPEQPVFSLVPGNNAVTLIWEASSTEDTAGEGDPFFGVAGDPASSLFNPNYRQFDVEGYRIWRGTNAGNLRLLAQFDYSGTTFTDITCETLNPDEDSGDFAPVGNPNLGFVVGETCPVDFSKVSRINTDLVFNNGFAGGPPGGGVVRLADLSALATSPTVTIVDDDGGALVPLTDGGVPFVFTDNAVTNNFTYFYSVSVFDVNSLSSGPHTLRSARVTQVTVPRADAPNVVNAELVVTITGDDGVALNPNAPLPSIDSETGIFSGPFPPTNGIATAFVPLLPRLLGEGTTSAVIDSIKMDWIAQEACTSGISFRGACFRIWTTSGGVQSVATGPTATWDGGFGRGAVNLHRIVNVSVPFDQAALDVFGIPSGSSAATVDAALEETINMSTWEGEQNRRVATTNTTPGGSRWFSGTVNTIEDPTYFIRVGQLAEVDSVWVPVHHTDIGDGTQMANSGSVQFLGYYIGFLARAADLRVTWNGGTISVRDVTHNVDVPFSPDYGSSWGFLNTDCDSSGGVDWVDFFCVGEGQAQWDADLFGPSNGPNASFSQTPQIVSIGLDTQNPQPATHTGFALYLNGMRHFFVTNSLPPDGTVWTLRTYNGAVKASTGTLTTDPSGYTYQQLYDDTRVAGSAVRSPMIPGLTINFTVANATVASGPVDLAQIHTVPDPYLGTSLYDLSPTSKQLMFVNLPPEATIRIYTLTGILVDVIVHEDITAGGRAVWSVRNRNQQFVASGVYFYHVITPEGDEIVKKFTIINQAGSN